MLRASLGKVVHTVQRAGTFAAKVSPQELHKIAVHVRAVAPTFHVGAHIYGLWNNLCVAQLLLELRIFLERQHFNRRRHFMAPTF